MLITPDGNVTLYNNVPLQSDYKITYWFDTKVHQSTFFNSYSKVELFPSGTQSYRGKFSYIKRSAGVIRVECNTNKLMNCSYMSFTNSGVISSTQQFENKTYYCFVNRIEYVNNTTSDIYYSIDLIQTYLFDIELKECFIVRQHNETDEMYENLQPEDLDTGEYITDGLAPYTPDYPTQQTLYTSDFSIVVMYNANILEEAMIKLALGTDVYNVIHFPMEMYSGIYQGCQFLIVPCTKTVVEKLDLLLDGLDQSTLGGIINIFILPTFCIPDKAESTETDEHFAQRQLNKSFYTWKRNSTSTNIVRKTGSFSGYTPINKKLYTYPYCCLYATNFRGSNNTYKYEYFTYATNSDNITMTIEGNFSASPSIMLMPIHYKNTTFTDNNLYVSNFPVCSFAHSTLVDWVASNLMVSVGEYSNNNGTHYTEYGLGHNFAVEGNQKYIKEKYKNHNYIELPQFHSQLSTRVASSADILKHPEWLGNQVPSDYKQKLSSEVIDVQTRLGQYGRVPVLFGDKMIGCASTDIMFGNNTTKTFGIYPMEIRREYAERIDKFFSRFGYAQNKFAVPNIHARSNWTFIQTEGCYVVGNNIQNEHERSIETIFNNGITFWVYNGVSTIGDFSHPENNTVLVSNVTETLTDNIGGENNG